MINLEEILKKLAEGKEKEKSTAELKSLGLSDYYIRKAVENGSLEKISRGKYKVVNVEKDLKRRQAFGNFQKAVFNRDYEKAYDYLLINYQNQTSDDYIYHLKYYFLLLKEILKDKKDFSFLDDVVTVYDTTKKDMSYYQHFRDFTEAILLQDFEKAYQYIKLFKDAEKTSKGYSSSSTNIFYSLALQANYKIVNEKKLNKMLPILLNQRSEEITVEELEQLGFNKYLIALAEERNILETTKESSYKIVAITKNANSKEAFAKFREATLHDEFEEAYNHLYTCYLNRFSPSGDHHLKLYFILLEEILKDKKELKNTNELTIPSEITQKEPYQKHFIDFSNAVVANDFEKAYQSLKIFKRLEKEESGFNSLSTKLFYRLSSYIDYMRRTKIKEDRASSENPSLSIKHFEMAQENIECENFEKALINLKLSKSYASGKRKINLDKMIDIISKYLEMKVSQKPLPVKELDYSNLNDDYNLIFNAALHRADYKTAYKNIGKCLFKNKNSKSLQFYRTLLSVLIEENKKIENLASKGKAQEELPRCEESTDATAVKSVKKVDIKTILELVNLHKYEEVKEILKNNNALDNRVYQTALDMIKYMDNIRKTNQIRERDIHFYKNDISKIFNRFFEALNYRCYEEAFTLVDECIERAEKNNDSEKFILYKYILGDILNLKEEIKRRQVKEQKIKNLTRTQMTFLEKQEIETYDLENIENITLEKLELLSDEQSIYDKYLLEIIETLRDADDYNLDYNSFKRFSYTEDNISDRFFKALSQGDYLEAYQISKDEKFYSEMNKKENSAYLELYKKLLFQLNKRIETNSQPVEAVEHQDAFIDNDLINQLETLRKLFETGEYKAAYQFYLENSLEGINSELDELLQVSRKFFDKTIQYDADKIKCQYKKAINRGDFDKASDYLNKYQEFITKNDLGRNIDYFQARLEKEKLEVNTEDFVEKIQLYDRAIHYMEMEKYEKAIELLDEYIKKDNNLSARGYLSRGRCKEYLKRFYEARADYEKAISIIPEPNAFHRLGKLKFYNEQYEEALNYFLAYEERRPAANVKNLEALSATYEKLGQTELSDKYKTLSKKASN